MSKFFSRKAAASAVSRVVKLPILPKVAAFLGRVIDVCLYAVAFLLPLFFVPWTLDVIELNKQTLLVALACVAGVAWVGRCLAEKRVAISRSWLHIAVGAFALGYLLVSLFSHDRYLSFVGVQGQMSWAFSTIAALVILYAVAVNRLRTTTQIYNLIFAFLLSSCLAALFGLAQAFGLFLIPLRMMQIRTFTSIGSAYGLAIYLVAPLLMAATLAFHGCRNHVCLLGEKHLLGIASRVLMWVTIVACLAFLVVVNVRASWLLLGIGTILTVGLGYARSRKVGHPAKLAIPVALLGIAVVFFFTKVTIGVTLPGEISPSAQASWEIARQTIQAHPLFGSGPGTWIYDYARFRTQAINLSPFWDTRFDRGYSSFLTLLASVGIVGTGLWLLLLISVVVKSFAHLVRERDDDEWYAFLTVFVGWSCMAASAFFYPFNLSHQILFWFLLALLGSLVAKKFMVWDVKKTPIFSGLLSVLFVIVLIGGISLLWLAGQRLAAELFFSNAVGQYQTGKPVTTILDELGRAKQLNPLNDTYARNLSQAYLLRAMETAKTSSGTETSNQFVEDTKTAIARGIEARETTPANVDNWSNLGVVYEAIAPFTEGANDRAIEQFVGASQREPQNAAFLMEIGKIYLMKTDVLQVALTQKDAIKRAAAQKQVQDDLNKAADYLMKSVAAKPDYMPARYYLGLVHERQGQLREAILGLESVLRANTHDIGVAFELALLYYRHSEKNRAMDLLEQIVRADPLDANAHWYLASVYEDKGRLDDAIAQVALAAAQLPRNAAVQQRLATLRQARDAKTAPAAHGLPDPLPQTIRGPVANNPLMK